MHVAQPAQSNQAFPQLVPPQQLSLADQIYQSLRHALLHGELPPGTRMVESVIAEQLGVSRTPVREALNRLTVEGWLISRRNKGVVVAGVQPEDVEERYSLRGVLEAYAAGIAATRMPEDEIARLHSVCDAAEATLPDDNVTEFARLNDEFHLGVIRAAGNATLLTIWRQFLHPAPHGYVALGNREMRRRFLTGHREVLKAIAARDAEGARDAMQAHLHYAMETYLGDDETQEARYPTASDMTDVARES
jgi:DNA-binding GntR family transcriptional regulator